MKVLWCWCCQQEMLMLEAEEATLVRAAILGGMRVVEEEARRQGRLLIPIELDGVARIVRPMLEMYRLLTGFVETTPNAILPHEVAQ